MDGITISNQPHINDMNYYIQYLTENLKIKTVSIYVEFVDNVYSYKISNIIEPFFIVGLFHQNKRIDGLSFIGLENLNMISFINDFSSYDISFVQLENYFNAEQVVYLTKTFDNASSQLIDFPQLQTVHVDNLPTVQTVHVENYPMIQNVKVLSLPISRYPFYHQVPNDITGISIHAFLDGSIDLYNISSPSYSLSYEYKFNFTSVNNGGFNEYTYKGLTVYIPYNYHVAFDLVINEVNNQFDIQWCNQNFTDIPQLFNISYLGQKKGVHKYLFDYENAISPSIYIAYNSPVGFELLPF